MKPAALALLLFVAACGAEVASSTTEASPTTTGATTTTTTSRPPSTTAAPTTTQPPFGGGGAEYPPGALEDLAAIVDPLVAPLGYKLGRGVLIDRNTYRETPTGNHLALYLEPLEEKTPNEYAAEFLPIATLFVPAVFAAWPGLVSFDVCQEPFDWQGTTAPPGLTVFDIDRETAAGIDWATIDLAGLLDLATTEAGLSIHATQTIEATAEWRAARDG
jgi:hypothetical protein